jgi:hypothetical protein
VFPTCSIQVPNEFLSITKNNNYQGITQDGDQEGFSHLWGGGVKKGKNKGWGEGKNIMVTKRFLVTTIMWQLNLVAIRQHQLNSVATRQWLYEFWLS